MSDTGQHRQHNITNVYSTWQTANMSSTKLFSSKMEHHFISFYKILMFLLFIILNNINSSDSLDLSVLLSCHICWLTPVFPDMQKSINYKYFLPLWLFYSAVSVKEGAQENQLNIRFRDPLKFCLLVFVFFLVLRQVLSQYPLWP